MPSLVYGVQGGLGIIGENGLALCKGYEYEVLNPYLLWCWGFYDNFLNHLLRFLGQLAPQVVDLCVEHVYLRLVPKLGYGEVVCAIGVPELVDNASIELRIGTVDIVLHASVSQFHSVFTSIAVVDCCGRVV